ncbi:MAG: DUF4886 domain-containing protein [Clostridia bacterium]|nr:DUF4886 domain-containing protein [Clostridia bacterium]
MRTNIKKALAVLMTLVMLCGLLPLGMLSVSAATNLVSNGTFESGTSGWSTSSTVSVDTSDPGSGSQSLKLDCTTVDYAWTYVTVTVSANTDYVLTFKGKTANAGLMVNFQSNWADISAQIPRYTVGSSSTWTDCSYEFNTGSYTSLMIYFQSSWAKGTGSYVWIDDVAVTAKETEPEPEPEVPTGENLIVNGSFEDGTNGWSMSSAGSVVSGGQEGASALQMKDPTTAYSGIAYQYVTVEPGKAYTLTWYAKRVSGTGIFNLYYDGATRTSGQNWMNETSGNWVQYQVELTINATTTSLLVKFSNEAANTSGTVLIDNVVLTKNPEASFDGYITNGDFEIGTMQGWNCAQAATAKAEAAHSGNYGAHITNPAKNYGGMVYQNTVNVVAGKTYTVSFWINVTVGYVNFQIKDGSTTGTNLTSKGYNSNVWTQGSFTVTPTTNVLCINFCGGNTGLVDEAYLDDVLVVEEKDPSFDGYIYNGDFETGKNNPWAVHQSTAISAEAKYEGNFGMKLSGVGTNWGGLLNQTISNLKVGQTYNLTLMMKVLADGVNLQVTSGSTTLASNYYATNNAGDWTAITLTFVADATTAVFNVCGSGNSGATVTVYMDNVMVGREGGEIYPEELIRFGGSSIRDAEEATAGTGYGLAFKFSVEATSCQKTFENEYVESSGKIVLDENEYTLVRMGAVMTNQDSVGQSAANFTLDAVNGGKIINIPAVYLAGLSAEDVSFAVRILDIPEHHTGTTIYARPYYVYLENGQETIVYGDIKSDSYAKVSNPKSSIKILSIGHSFSKDVMETYLWNMFKEGGYDEVIIGYLYIGGCPMPKHLYNIQNNRADYEYGKNSNGNWVKQYNVTALSALKDEEWDYVNIQSSPDYIGGQTLSQVTLENNGGKVDVNMTEYECITPITDWIKANALNSAVKTDYHMIWAFSEGCNLWSYTYHNYNQLTMYNNIINITREKVVPHEAINNIIPCATSIQNGRTSFIGDNFNEPDASTGGSDGYHLNSKYGDYTAALTWYCHYSGDDATVMNGYTGDLSAEEFEAIAEAVNNAMTTPYAITASTHS